MQAFIAAFFVSFIHLFIHVFIHSFIHRFLYYPGPRFATECLTVLIILTKKIAEMLEWVVNQMNLNVTTQDAFLKLGVVIQVFML